MSRTWTTEEVGTLTMGFARAESDEWIASRTGRSARAVALKRHKLGLLVRPISRAAVRDYATETLVDEVRRRGYRVDSPTSPTAEHAPSERVAFDKSRWSVRGTARVGDSTKRGVSHTVRGDTPHAAKLAWARAVRSTGGKPLLPSASVRLIEETV